MFESRTSAGALENYLFLGNRMRIFLHGIVTWKVMQKKCVEIFCELSNKTTQQLHKVATPCIDDHQFKEEEMGSVGELSKVCLTYTWLVIGGPDILMVREQTCSCSHKVDEIL